MKRTTIIAAVLIALSINLNAQVRVKPNNQGPVTYQPRNEPKSNPAPQNNNQSGEHWGHSWGGGHPQGYVSLNFGYNSPYYGNPYYYNNYYANGYSIKKSARYSIRAAGQIINEAVAFDTWNDMYSPLLAKAIRHYNYARQLYWWGNYNAALNHAERANYLAWYSLQYFQNPGCGGGYNGGGYDPNPYSDPYNPYYRTDKAGGSAQNGGNENYKSQGVAKTDELDTKLPGSDVSDKELLKSFDKTELKDE